MPNWCYNNMCVTHEDPAKITILAQKLKDGRMFEHFVPLPNGEWDYDFCVGNWGTKWEISGPEIHAHHAKMLDTYFMTAWAPPTKVYEKMKEQGYVIQAEYWEEGGFFVGKWDDGVDRCFSPDNAPDDMSHLVANSGPYPDEDGEKTTAIDAKIDAEALAHEAETNSY